MHNIKEAIEKNMMVMVDDGSDNNQKVKLILSQSAFTPLSAVNKSKNLIAHRIFNTLNQTMETWRMIGQNPPKVLRLYIDAKMGLYYEAVQIQYNETGEKAILVFMPGQLNIETGEFRELTTEYHEKLKAQSTDVIRENAKNSALNVIKSDVPESIKTFARKVLEQITREEQGEHE